MNMNIGVMFNILGVYFELVLYNSWFYLRVHFRKGSRCASNMILFHDIVWKRASHLLLLLLVVSSVMLMLFSSGNSSKPITAN